MYKSVKRYRMILISILIMILGIGMSISVNAEYLESDAEYVEPIEEAYVFDADDIYTEDDLYGLEEEELAEEEPDSAEISEGEMTDHEPTSPSVADTAISDMEIPGRTEIKEESDDSFVQAITENETLSVTEEPAFALPDAGECGNNATYTLSTDGTLTISGSGAISTSDFSMLGIIKKVKINSGITEIGERTFFWCENLASASIPSSVTKIGEMAFGYCSSLESVTLSYGLTEIGDGAFSGSVLKQLTIPSSVKRIGQGAFSGCRITSVKIPQGITDIYSDTFCMCGQLSEVTLPEGLEQIESDAFTGCEISSIYIPPSVNWIASNAFDNTVTIRGYKDSYAEEYAINNNLSFISLGHIDISTAQVILDDSYGLVYEYERREVSPDVQKVILNGIYLDEFDDYEVVYQDNKNVGTGKVIVKGKNAYNGQVIKTFTIKPCSFKNNLIVNGVVSKIYDGKAQTQQPVVYYLAVDPWFKLEYGRDYYIDYKNNVDTGRATMAIKGKGNYSGVQVVYFAVLPKPSWIAKLESPKTKQIKITWGKRSHISGYQIEISTNKNFNKPKMQKNVYKPNQLSLNVKVLKSKTTYYVRIRSFKKASYKTYFSKWSNTKTIKTK